MKTISTIQHAVIALVIMSTFAKNVLYFLQYMKKKENEDKIK